jgi:AAA15 family ATPase/GTPase
MLTPSIQYLKELQRRLAKSGDLINLINMMRTRISYFTDIREVDENFLVFVKGLSRPFPLEAMGDGFRAKLAILSAIATVKRGVALMEEHEIRLHPGYMSLIANQIAETAVDGDIQYIISTHSLDFLEFLLEVNAELVKVVRMYREEGTSEIDYEVLDGKEALEELNVLKMDLRGV